jgi:ribulose-5-phosphate 4-epimerase/fuculose-1-phosphate aldolase
MSEDTAKAKAALERAVQAALAAQADELHAHRHGSIAAQQVARQAVWNALHARDVARLELRVLDLNERCRESGYAQDVDDAVDAERALASLRAAGPRTSL